MLAKLSETSSKWDRVLDQVEFAINNTVCRATGETPVRLLFGLDQRGKSNDSLRDIIERNLNVERNFDLLRNNACDKISETQRRGAEQYNLRRKAARQYTLERFGLRYEMWRRRRESIRN